MATVKDFECWDGVPGTAGAAARTVSKPEVSKEVAEGWRALYCSSAAAMCALGADAAGRPSPMQAFVVNFVEKEIPPLILQPAEGSTPPGGGKEAKMMSLSFPVPEEHPFHACMSRLVVIFLRVEGEVHRHAPMLLLQGGVCYSCSKPAALRCQACKVAYFCGRACQKRGKEAHATLCEMFALPSTKK